MPAAFSTASAHEFAAYGVALLSAIGVDAVVFGSECGQIEILKQAAYALNHESAEFQERLRKGLKAGLTYPQARAKALGETQAGGTRVENVEDFHANTDVSNSHIWSSILILILSLGLNICGRRKICWPMEILYDFAGGKRIS